MRAQGTREEALDYLLRAVELQASFAEYAQSDDDLASIRDDPAFPAGEVPDSPTP